MKKTTLTNPSKRRFEVRLIEKGESYGLNDCLTHDKEEPFIEFIDITNPDCIQMVSRYYARTISSIDSARGSNHAGAGLALHGDEPLWDLSPDNIEHVKAELL